MRHRAPYAGKKREARRVFRNIVGIDMVTNRGENHKRPKVSVIVPFRNRKKELARCLDSLANQTMQDVEIILVDNGSDDGAEDVAREFSVVANASQVVDCFILGAGAARNQGVEVSSGEYLFFLDSDDWLEPHCLEKLVVEAESTHADVVVCGYVRLSPGSEQLNYFRSELKKGLPLSAQPEILRSAHAFAWGKLFRTQFWLRNNFKFPHSMFEDIALIYIVLASAKNLSFVDEPLYWWDTRAPMREARRALTGSSQIFAAVLAFLNYFKVSAVGKPVAEQAEAEAIRCLGDRIGALRVDGSFSEILKQTRLTRKFLDENLPSFSRSHCFKRQPKPIRLSIQNPWLGSLRIVFGRKIRPTKIRIGNWVRPTRRGIKGLIRRFFFHKDSRGQLVGARGQPNIEVCTSLESFESAGQRLFRYTNFLEDSPRKLSGRVRSANYIEMSAIYRNFTDISLVRSALQNKGFHLVEDFIVGGFPALQTWYKTGQEISLVYLEQKSEFLVLRVPVLGTRDRINPGPLQIETFFLVGWTDNGREKLQDPELKELRAIPERAKLINSLYGNRSRGFGKKVDVPAHLSFGEYFRVSRRKT